VDVVWALAMVTDSATRKPMDTMLPAERTARTYIILVRKKPAA